MTILINFKLIKKKNKTDRIGVDRVAVAQGVGVRRDGADEFGGGGGAGVVRVGGARGQQLRL